jgi:hypothetical protein
MKTISIFIVLGLFLSSCYSTKITPEFLSPKSQNKELISELNFEFDDYSFSSVFQPSQKIVDEIIEDQGITQREISVVKESQNSVDAKNLLRKYWSSAAYFDKDSRGTIVFTATFYDFKESGVLRGFSLMSFGLLNLAGLPTGRYSNTVEILASVYDPSGKLLNSFTGFGHDVYHTGIYYHNYHQKRPSFIKAVKNAIDEIDRQIIENQSIITANLN